MTSTDYASLDTLPLAQLRQVPAWTLAHYLAQLGPVRRQMIYQALAA